MRKTLIATSALAFAGAVGAAPASAADMLALGVGGYMEQWVGFVSRDDDNSDGGMDIQSDSEIFFKGKFASDMGLTFGVDVQLEGNQTGAGATTIDESFVYMSGDFGRLEIGARDSIQARTHYAISDVGILLNAGDTQKWIPGAYLDTNGWLGDNLNVIYISPRVNGIQAAFSYGADAGSEKSSASAPNGNDDAVWAAGINFNQSIGDAGLKVSLGHRSRSQSATDAAGDGSQKSRDDDTFTNVGLAVSTGAFGLNLAYAERDQGTYSCGQGATDSLESCVENGAGQWSVMGVSVTYSDGPMAFSVGHMIHDTDANTERNATMVSMKYALAPGVDWKSSAFMVDDTTSGAEGTAFVTGLDLSF